MHALIRTRLGCGAPDDGPGQNKYSHGMAKLNMFDRHVFLFSGQKALWCTLPKRRICQRTGKDALAETKAPWAVPQTRGIAPDLT